MLILSRKLYETLIVSDNITITILEIKGNQARMGINVFNGTSAYIEEGCQKAKRKIKYRRFLNKSYKILLKIYRIFTDLHIPVFLAKLK